MGYGDLSHFPFEEICDMCMNYSQGKEKSSKGSQDILSRVTNLVIRGETRA